MWKRKEKIFNQIDHRPGLIDNRKKQKQRKGGRKRNEEEKKG